MASSWLPVRSARREASVCLCSGRRLVGIGSLGDHPSRPVPAGRKTKAASHGAAACLFAAPPPHRLGEAAAVGCRARSHARSPGRAPARHPASNQPAGLGLTVCGLFRSGCAADRGPPLAPYRPVQGDAAAGGRGAGSSGEKGCGAGTARSRPPPRSFPTPRRESSGHHFASCFARSGAGSLQLALLCRFLPSYYCPLLLFFLRGCCPLLFQTELQSCLCSSYTNSQIDSAEQTRMYLTFALLN